MESPGIEIFLVPTFPFQATRPSSPQPSILSLTFMLAPAGDVDSERMQRFHFYSNPAAKKKVGFFRARDFSLQSPSPLLRGFPARAEWKEMEVRMEKREKKCLSLSSNQNCLRYKVGGGAICGNAPLRISKGGIRVKEGVGEREIGKLYLFADFGTRPCCARRDDLCKKKYITLTARNKTAPSFEGTVLFLPSNT